MINTKPKIIMLLLSVNWFFCGCLHAVDHPGAQIEITTEKKVYAWDEPIVAEITLINNADTSLSFYQYKNEGRFYSFALLPIKINISSSSDGNDNSKIKRRKLFSPGSGFGFSQTVPMKVKLQSGSRISWIVRLNDWYYFEENSKIKIDLNVHFESHKLMNPCGGEVKISLGDHVPDFAKGKKDGNKPKTKPQSTKDIIISLQSKTIAIEINNSAAESRGKRIRNLRGLLKSDSFTMRFNAMRDLVIIQDDDALDDMFECVALANKRGKHYQEQMNVFLLYPDYKQLESVVIQNLDAEVGSHKNTALDAVYRLRSERALDRVKLFSSDPKATKGQKEKAKNIIETAKLIKSLK